MERKCARCGFIKADADMSATEVCSKCGAIFSKSSIAAATALRSARAPEERSSAQSKPSLIERFLWVVTIVGCGIGIAQLSITFATAQSAPQQAAGAGMAIATAVIPYCLARAVQLATRK
jgi:hypothetical protein